MPTADPDVSLRPWTDGDLPLLRGLLADPAMMTYLGGPESEEKLLARYRFIYAFPAVENGPSNGVCAKLGFERLGTESLEYPPGVWMDCAIWRRQLRP